MLNRDGPEALGRVVIVGAGQGGHQVAASLRQEGFAGDVVLVGDEPGLPYQRPPLSKAYLQGELGVDKLWLRPERWFAEQRIALRQGRVVSIDRRGRSVSFDDGSELAYDHLVLATGARNRTLALPNAALPNVLGLRTLADADTLGALLRDAQRVVVVGAGFIGLEFAAVAARRGLAVQMLDVAPRPMARAVSPALADHVRAAHEGSGVRFHFGQGVVRLEAEGGRVVAVHTTGGQRLDTDLVVLGIGVEPDTGLAASAGLPVDDGIVVDEALRTADPAISAIGDAACFPCVHTGGQRLRLESVQNAVDQARSLAATLMGRPAAYAALPWFWSDQGDLKLQIAGLSTGHDRLVSIDGAQGWQKTVLCFRAGRLVAVETVDRPGDHMAARRLLARAPRLSPEQAAEDGFTLKAHEIATR